MNKSTKIRLTLNEFRAVEFMDLNYIKDTLQINFTSDNLAFINLIAQISQVIGFNIMIQPFEDHGFFYSIFIPKKHFTALVNALDDFKHEATWVIEGVTDDKILNLVKMLREDMFLGGIDKDANEILDTLLICEHCDKEIYTKETLMQLINDSKNAREAFAKLSDNRCCKGFYYGQTLEDRKMEYAEYLSDRLLSKNLVRYEDLEDKTTEQILESYRICNNCREELYTTAQQNMAIMEYETAEKTFEVLGEIQHEH